MELYFVRIFKVPCVFHDVETGIKTVFFFKEHEIENADTDAFFEYAVFLSRFNLAGIHFRGIEQGTFSPYFHFGKLDLGINFGVVIHEYAYVQDAEFVVFMCFAQIRVQDAGCFDVRRF